MFNLWIKMFVHTYLSQFKSVIDESGLVLIRLTSWGYDEWDWVFGRCGGRGIGWWSCLCLWSAGNFGNFGCALQIIDFEPLHQNNERRCGLWNLNEGSSYRGKGAVKISWRSEHDKAIKLILGRQKCRKSGKLIGKRNRIAPKMGILKKFKSV